MEFLCLLKKRGLRFFNKSYRLYEICGKRNKNRELKDEKSALILGKSQFGDQMHLKFCHFLNQYNVTRIMILRTDQNLQSVYLVYLAYI